MTFADITIVPVPSERKDAYLEFSRRMAEVYREHGATNIVDYWQAERSADQAGFHCDGATYAPGALRGIASIAGATDAESVVVTVTEWPSREVRDRGTAAATRDPRVVATLDETPVFDGSRLAADSFAIAMRVDSQ
ncbi:DUF1428 domain-containing protein [Gordonia sp. HY285]|uniref:DUF1428 domain-containing protein n=1 Tax=Gordonia liuliyuniae TaxID=2911517 RepID=UPI001F40C54A|nr:DUF1428 family protein [Gordonia liuliyuniae]MCF8610945.1 DUF1428 domain-containing protein [Gordonia liuliyuniae]